MPAICPEGHLSDVMDRCDQCGAEIAPAINLARAFAGPGASGAEEPSPALTAPDESAQAPPSPVPSGAKARICPACGAANLARDRFCSACGHEMSLGASGAARERIAEGVSATVARPTSIPPVRPPAAAAPTSADADATPKPAAAAPTSADADAAPKPAAAAPTSADADAAPTPAAAAPTSADADAAEAPAASSPGPAPAASGAGPATASKVPSKGWEVVATADLEYYERRDHVGVAFPESYTERSFSLATSRCAIGRATPGGGRDPEVDLAGDPEDPGILGLHAVLLGSPEGGWKLLVPGAAGATFVNDDPDPVRPNFALTLKDGDRIHAGAWTTLTLRSL